MNIRLMGVLVLACAARLPAAWAAGPCATPTNWDEFTSIAITVDTQAPVSGSGFPMRVEQTKYADGMRFVGIDHTGRIDIVSVDRADGTHTLASAPKGPLDHAEAGMTYETPLMALKRQFHGLCEMTEKTAYPVDIRQGNDALSGILTRKGDAVFFVLKESRGFTYVGNVGYHRPRATLPTNLPILGWTVFSGSAPIPGQGTPSTFKTLGEFESSLVPATPVK